MKTFLLSSGFCIYVMILMLHFVSVIGVGNETDQQALLNFKEEISDDPFGILSSWNMSVHFCQWQGVTCSRRHQRVTVLNLNSWLLTGTISPHLGNLSFLRELHFFNNSFTGEIPAEIGRLRRLQILLLYGNQLGGEIPANISICSNLEAFSVGSNKLIGKIPDEFRVLTKLHFINIQFNDLTGGIPSFFGNFSSLEAIGATNNNLGGTIPDTLGQLKNLYFLAFDGNMLTGTIPSSLYNLSSVEVFSFPENQLEGNLPSELGNTLPNLTSFNVADNLFTGRIPASLSNASNLEKLTIPINKFEGNLPSLEKLTKLSWISISNNNLGTGKAGDLDFLSTLSNATSLQLLAINSNNFGGELPLFITNFTNLEVMTLNNNQISGSIPKMLGNLINLEMLNMGNNSFTGEIPDEIGKLKGLIELRLPGNKFSGKIPSSLGNLTMLTHLDMQQNALWGGFPPSIGNCQQLLSLNLNQNNLSGAIPSEVMSIPSLAIYLGLSQNYLTGSLPSEVGTLTNLGTLDVSHNMLTGEIPSSLGSCVNLEFLYLHHNFFRGNIPSSLSSLKALQVLDLSHNNLTGNIPDFFESFSLLQSLNLSYNDFEGELPNDGVFMNLTSVSIAGNSKLCGGVAEYQLSPCDNQKAGKGRLSLAVKLVIAASGTLFVILVLSALFLLLYKKRSAEQVASSYADPTSLMSYQNLLKATGGFSAATLLGVGSFGSVYKGKLNGMTVAVKVLNLLQPAASKSFKTECRVLSNVRHRNLVKLLNAYSGVDYKGNDFKALVYEFMSNGSLEEWLYPDERISESLEYPRRLNFLQRVNIANDVASALEYLHHGCSTPIIHCDLKPSNVLLDHNMVGHVGDFGLARFFTYSLYKTSAFQSSTIGLRGSIGYTAPEYGMGNDVSTTGDVYSYGILLLEMFTGKRPTNEMFKDGSNLHNHAKAALSEQAEEILDPILIQEINMRTKMEGSSGNNKGNSKIQECIFAILEMGVACSAEFPGERMHIRDVTAELHAIKEKLLNE